MSIIVSILIPLVVVSYIIVDLYSKHIAKIPQMSYDAKIDEKNHDSGENYGERFSESEILENTAHLMDNYADVFLK